MTVITPDKVSPDFNEALNTKTTAANVIQAASSQVKLKLNKYIRVVHPAGSALPLTTSAQLLAVKDLKAAAARIVPKTSPNDIMSILTREEGSFDTVKKAAGKALKSSQPTTPNTFQSFLNNDPATTPVQALAPSEDVESVIKEQKDNPILAIGLTLLTLYVGYKLYKRYTQSDRIKELELYTETLSEILNGDKEFNDAFRIVRNGHASQELFAKKKKVKAYFSAANFMRKSRIKDFMFMKNKKAFRPELVKHLAEKKAELKALKSRVTVATVTSTLGSLFSKLGNTYGFPRLV